ncbi:unnamed protein product [Rotaria sp. Silwood1]|nr:unnamed protein product [Rotaria sp. Silwood1]CAF1677275.1 unnamed protein product [Rotaria sp. Silwood1]
MYALNHNQQLKQHERFMDTDDEPLIMMTPIKGYGTMPLVSLEEAVKPLIPFVSEIEQMVYVVKERCQKPPADQLSVDESAAIMLYTLEWKPKEESVYYILNKTLRNENRQSLKPWFLYLKLFVAALSRLPSTQRTIYRGIKIDMRYNDKYRKGASLIWWGFSSCTSSMDVLENEAFLGSSGSRILFAIECQSGKDIREHSYVRNENEILLPAARELKVKAILQQPGGLSLIQLKEIQPKYPLLESFSTINQVVQSSPLNPSPDQFKTQKQPKSSNPMIIQPAQLQQGKIQTLSHVFRLTLKNLNEISPIEMP